MKTNGPYKQAPPWGEGHNSGQITGAYGARRKEHASEEEASLMAGLAQYLTERHVRNSTKKVEGWTSKVLHGIKYNKHVYLDPEGQVYHSKGQVLAALREGLFEEKPHECRVLPKEEALNRAQDLFRRKGAELVGDRGPGAPAVQVFDLLVENLGRVDTRPGFHSTKSIFPVGYKVLKLMVDGRTLRAIKARCSIFLDCDAPAFRIEVLGSSIPEGQPTTFESPTQKGCFGKVFEALGTAGRRAKESVLGGPVFFNLAVKTLIEGMPGSGDCENYVFIATKPGRGSGSIPMFKKTDSAEAAERAEKRLRGELEKTWWRGLTEAEKEKVRVAERQARGRRQEDCPPSRGRSKSSVGMMRPTVATKPTVVMAKPTVATKPTVVTAKPTVATSATPTTTARKCKPPSQRRRKDPAEDKQRQLVAIVTREVQTFITVKRKEARAVVLARSDDEQRWMMTDSGAVDDSLLEGFSDPRPRPSSVPGGSGSGGGIVVVSSPDRTVAKKAKESSTSSDASSPSPGLRLRLPEGVLLKHAVEVWNALCVFPRPMGLRPPPPLEKVMGVIQALCPPRSGGSGVREANGNNGAAVGADAVAVNSGPRLHDSNDDEEEEFDDQNASIRATGSKGDKATVAATSRDEGAAKDDGAAKKDAQAMLDGFCVSVVRMLAVDLHTVLGSPCDPPREKPRDAVSMEEVLVINQMTWPEVARQCIIAHMATALNTDKADITAWVRGSGRDSSAEGPAHRLLRRRVEARWAPAAADPRPSIATVPSASIAPSASDAPVDSEESRELQEWEAGAAALDEEANELSAIDELLPIPDDECGIAETVGGAEHENMEVDKCGIAETIGGAERDDMEVDEGARGHDSPAGGGLCDKNDESTLLRRLRALVRNEGRPESVRRCALVLREIARHKCGCFFLFPVDRAQVPEYFAVIEHPITVSSLLDDLEASSAQGDGKVVDIFVLSVRRMWENCWGFNSEGTQEWEAAERLSCIFERLVREWMLRSSPPPPRVEAILEIEARPCSACGMVDDPAEALTCRNGGGGGDMAAAPTLELQSTILCHGCDATYHMRCVWPPLTKAPRVEWFCPACVHPDPDCSSASVQGSQVFLLGSTMLSRPPPFGGFGFRSRWLTALSERGRLEMGGAVEAVNCSGGGCIANGGEGEGGCGSGGGSGSDLIKREPPLLSISGDSGPLETDAISASVSCAGNGFSGSGAPSLSGLGRWGPSLGVPKALDWSLSRRVREFLETEEQARVLHDALRILSRPGGGWLPSPTSCWSPGEWVVVLASIVAIYVETPTLHGVFAEADQRSERLRKKSSAGDKAVAKIDFCGSPEEDSRRKRREASIKACVIERLLGTGGGASGGWRAKVERCESCAGCRAKACGECLYCDDPRLSREHLCIKRRCINEWKCATSGGDADGNSPEVECEYCQRRERELCSPMVIDLSPEATEEFLKRQDAEKSGDAGEASEGPHRKVRFPRFPRARHGSRRAGGREAKIGSSRPSGPTVHEVCAQAMFKARAEKTQDKLRGLREQEAEETIRIEGCRTRPLGRDRHGRYYFRLPGDSRKVFVGPASKNPSNGGEEYGIDDGGNVAADRTSLLLPPDPAANDLGVYEREGDLEALVAWLNESGRREGPLRAALLRAFPYLRSKTSSTVTVTEGAARATGVGGLGEAVDDGARKFAAEEVIQEGETPEYRGKGKGKGKAQCIFGETITRGTVEGDDGRKGCNGNAGGSCDGGTRANGGEARSGSPALPASTASPASSTAADGGDDRAVLAGPSRNRELLQLLKDGLVELELVLNPPGSGNTVVAPASEVVLEFEHDGKVQKDDGGGAPAMTWTHNKYHAIRLRHTPTGEVFVPSQKQGIILVFEIWLGGHMVGRTPNDAPYDKRTGVYFFTIPKFLQTGTFRLVFDVTAKQPLNADPVANAEELGELAPPAPPRRFAKVAPIELDVEVIPRFTQTGAISALHKLRAVGFLKQRHRHETETMPMSLDLPFDCDELTCLKAALLTVLNALPRGALLGGNESVAAQNPHSGRGNGEKGLGAAESGWTPQLRDCWLLHVGSATSCQELMEALLLLESCLDPKWVKSWYARSQEKMASTSYLLRLATPAAVALHLFSLDSALLYDKVSASVHRGARLRNEIQLRGRAGAPSSAKEGRGTPKGRTSKTSMHASASSAAVAATPPQTRGRHTRTSRAVYAGEDSARSPPRRGRPSGGASKGTKLTTRDGSHSPDSWEEDDNDDEEEGEDDDWEPERRSRGGSGGSGARGTRGTGRGGTDRGRWRPVKKKQRYDDDMDVDQGDSDQEDEESEDRLSEGERRKRKATAAPDVTDGSVPVSTSWDCPRCTVDNGLANTKCHLCGERRPASAIPAGARKRRRQLTAGLVVGNNGGGGSGGSNSSSSAENNAAADGDASGGARRRKRKRGKSNTGSTSASVATVAAAPRQRRNVARVNYAEVVDDEEDEGGGEGGRGTVSAGGHGAGGLSERGETARAEYSHLASIRPLRIKEELRRGGGKEEEGLTDEVRAFRRRVRSVVQSFSGEDFALHFREPVDLVMYPSYVDFVTEPMDLSTILFMLRSGVYDDVRDQTLLLRHINLIPTNCEAFNGKDVKITQNARLVARTFVGRLSENEPAVAMAAGLGESFSTFGGGVGSVCSACGVRLERGDDSLDLVSCEACKTVHHAICVLDPSGDAPWRCVACGGEN